jgi:hypothetical protein
MELGQARGVVNPSLVWRVVVLGSDRIRGVRGASGGAPRGLVRLTEDVEIKALSISKSITANTNIINVDVTPSLFSTAVVHKDVNLLALPVARVPSNADKSFVVGSSLLEQDPAILLSYKSNVEILRIIASSDQKA